MSCENKICPSVKKLFKSGKQGICGITVNQETFKVSQHINYLVEHEYYIMCRLKEMSHYCPNFCTPIRLLRDILIEPKPEKGTDPFKINSSHPIKKNVILEEYVKGEKLYKHIKSRDNDVVLSSIKQTLSAIAIAQEKSKFSHYDLHSDNIILEKCDPDDVYFYIFGENKHIVVPTFGFKSKIIDYGFSYIDSMDNQFFTGSFGHTDIGFMGDRFDWVADPKLFLVTLFNEIKNNDPKGQQGKTLEVITRNMFKPLVIDWECGWDDVTGRSATDILLELLSETPIESRLFKNNDNFCIDIITSLVELPLVNKQYNELSISYQTFVNEFFKIEKEINSSRYNLYILKCIIDSAKRCKKDYQSKTSRDSAVSAFRADISSAIMSVSKFCSPRNIKYELMLCSLYNLANCIEGIIYNCIKNTMHRKQKEYKKLSIENIYDVINIVNVNMEDDYIYNENTKIYIYDSVNETSAKLELSSSFIKKLNSAPKNMHSFLIDTYYKSVNENSTDSQSEDDDFLKNSDNYEDDVEYENDKEQDEEDEDDFLSD